MNKSENPYLKANLASRFFYCWLNKFLKKGTNVKDDDVYDVLKNESSHYQCEKLEKRWKEELNKSNGNGDQWMLARALFKTYGPYVTLWSIAFFFLESFKILQPFLIGKLIEHISTTTHGVPYDSTTAYLYATGICLCSIIPIAFLHHYFLAIFKTAMRMRISCCSLLYKKSLRLDIGSASSATVAQLINLMSNDVSRFDLAIALLPFLILGPLELIAVTLILWFYMGWGSLVGSLVLLLIIPISGVLAKVFSRLRSQTTRLTDKRLGLLTEVLNGIQYVKMCCWEELMEKKIDETRRAEIRKILLSGYARGANLAPSFYSGKLIILAALVCYVLTGNHITAQVVFVAISMYNPVRFSMTLCFPMAMQLGAESLVTVRRIQDFLTAEELPKPQKEWTASSDHNLDSRPPITSPFISAQNLTISWNSSDSPLLSGVTFEMGSKDLVMVIGEVGVGKTSLLMSILGELQPISGALEKHGDIAYVSQQAWISNGTIRDNILMGAVMQQERYDQAINSSCLDRDLLAMPKGDLTMVGDRGMGLSGGQKARVSLARAVYRGSQVYLLDDPLSAVDANVSLKLFERCINGCLKDTLRVLVTHQIQYLPQASKILYLDRHQGHYYGTYDQLKASGINVVKVLHKKQEDENDLSSHIVSSNEEPTADEDMPLLNGSRDVVANHVIEGQEGASNGRVDMMASCHSLAHLSASSLCFSSDADVDIVDSEVIVGTAIPAKTYYNYLTAGGGVVAFVLMLALNVVTQAMFLVADWWLVYWCRAVENENPFRNNNSFDPTLQNIFTNPTNINPTNPSPNPNHTIIPTSSIPPPSPSFNPQTSTDSFFYLGIFSILCFIVIFLSVFRALVSFHLFTKSNQQLHHRMLKNVIRCPMQFFVQNPAGRILNRFSKDVGHVDEMLPFFLFDLTQQLFLVVGVFVMLAVMNVWVLMAIVPMFVLFFLLRNYFLRSFRIVKRIEAKTKGPVFSHISATFQGLLTIRSHRAEGVFLGTFERLQDQHTASFSLLLGLGRWFAIRLEGLCSVVISVVTFAAVLASERMDAGQVGLSLSYSITLLWLFQWVVRQSTEVENLMTHVERIVEYTKLPIEEHYDSPGGDGSCKPSTKPSQPSKKQLKSSKQQPKAAVSQSGTTLPHDHSSQPLVVRVHSDGQGMEVDGWPSAGGIEFRGVSLAYQPSSPKVLKDLNFSIKAGEKIGIVGRTGAGKSSLINVIFKLVSFEGSVIVDGRDIHKVSTFNVRKSISIIPQDQVIMSGSLRDNLDPEHHYTDQHIWDSLNKVKLDTVFRQGGLDQQVKEGGSNLSIGQQQLLCMSRALLKKNKILLIDEATANVDRQTDSFIQSALRDHFSDLTVLTIAHRLITVIDCDKIMLMDKGRVIEFDTPHKLLTNKEGAFYGLASKVGVEELARLESMASNRDSKIALINQ